MESALYFFGGIADLFLSVMLWFVFDSEKSQTIFVDGDRVYAIDEIIKLHQPAINEECDSEEDQDDEDE